MFQTFEELKDYLSGAMLEDDPNDDDATTVAGCDSVEELAEVIHRIVGTTPVDCMAWLLEAITLSERMKWGDTRHIESLTGGAADDERAL